MAERERTRQEAERQEAYAQAKRESRTRETLEMAMGNVGRRRVGVKAETKAVEDMTRDCAVAAHAAGYTYDEIAERLQISRQRVAQLLGERAGTKAKRAAEAAEALKRAAKAARPPKPKAEAKGTDDGLVPAVADL